MAKKLVRFDWAMKRLLRNKANFDILEGFISFAFQDLFYFEILVEQLGKKAFQDVEVGLITEQPLHCPIESYEFFCHFKTICNKNTGNSTL